MELLHLGDTIFDRSATLEHDDARELQYASCSSRKTDFSIGKEQDDASNFKSDSTDKTCGHKNHKQSEVFKISHCYGLGMHINKNDVPKKTDAYENHLTLEAASSVITALYCVVR